jgi:tetratricopeptide (TPR) repeat protein
MWLRRGLGWRPGFKKTLAKGEAHFRRGRSHSKRDEWAAAAEAFEAALAEDEQPAEWHYQLAVALGKLQEWDRAAAAYANALAREDTRADWHGSLGRLRVMLRDWNEAVICFDAAIARDGENAEWFFRRGVAQEKLQELKLAAASYQAAIARNGTEPKYVQHLEAVRARMDAWAEEAKAHSVAVNCNPNDAWSRLRAAACFVRSGNEAGALAILAPSIAQSDVLLESFLAGRSADANHFHAHRQVLFVRGGRTTLVRKIVVGPDANPEIFFEHTRQGRSGAERVRDFYALVSDAKGAAPQFVPRLHHYRLYDQGGYFLYDYLECDSRQTARLFDRAAKLDPKLALGAIDRLIEISRLQYPAGHQVPICTGLRDLFTGSAENVDLYFRTAWDEHPTDGDYRRSLKLLSEDWANHQQRLNEAPQIFAHGNAQSPNAIVTENGALYLVDWESHGMGPVGIDFVALFRDRSESPQFEELGELYFRAVMPALGARERTDILALLAVSTAVVRDRPIPRKWLQYLTSR